jgi:hypothetical protein
MSNDTLLSKSVGCTCYILSSSSDAFLQKNCCLLLLVCHWMCTLFCHGNTLPSLFYLQELEVEIFLCHGFTDTFVSQC